MTLVISASGIRGTVEGPVGQNLTPLDIVEWVAAWGLWLRRRYEQPAVVVGQDARPSGTLLRPLALQTLRALGIRVWDAGLTTTPTLSMGIPFLQAQGGLILTASHNPAGWNALKLLNAEGEFLPPKAIEEIRALRSHLHFSHTDHPAPVQEAPHLMAHHLRSIVAHPWIQKDAIERAGLRLVVDGINSGGALFVPALLEALGVREVHLLHGEPTGHFAHPPEPLPENLATLAQAVREKNAHLGIAVDPDVDRVAFFLPDGSPFSEEYTLVVVADYVLNRQKGPVVANQSTTQAVAWVAQEHGVPFYESPVGEYHVVEKMKAVGAVMGGEGNGGVIWPALHYGRDALAGIALFLSALVETGSDAHRLRQKYPSYTLYKARLPLKKPLPPDFFKKLESQSDGATLSREDGLKLRWPDRWVHIRPSGTEPLLRLIAEAPTPAEAKALLTHWSQHIQAVLR